MKFPIKSDATANEALRNEVQEVRGTIQDAAESVQVPDRFQFTSSSDSPAMIITDMISGKSTEVPLYGYRAVRCALAELFN